MNVYNELANKYIEIARENVNIKKIFPPNRYTFTNKYFRKINGWDKKWYNTMYGWMDILKNASWKVSFYDRDAGESSILNFQYLYDSELPSCSSQFSLEDIHKIMNFSQLTPDKCSQLCIDKEEFYKLSNPLSKPFDFREYV